MADQTSEKHAPRVIEVSPDLTVRDLAGLLGTTPIEINNKKEDCNKKEGCT